NLSLLNPFDSSQTLNLLQPRIDTQKIYSAPSILNNTVYVLASGLKTIKLVVSGHSQAIQTPCTILLALKDDPGAATIKVGDVGDNFTLMQPDIALNTDPSNLTNFSTLRPGQFQYEREAGVIRISNLMSSNSGPMQNALSTSQPVLIRRSGQPDL